MAARHVGIAAGVPQPGAHQSRCGGTVEEKILTALDGAVTSAWNSDSYTSGRLYNSGLLVDLRKKFAGVRERVVEVAQLRQEVMRAPVTNVLR